MNRARLLALLLLTAALAGALALLAPLAQPLSYHEFADQRAFFGVPNFLNVLSNLALLLVAALGLGLLRRGSGAVFVERAERWPYVLFFLAVAATSLGSAWYHLAPDNTGAATVIYWHFSAALGAENVLPYFALQAYAILAVLVLLGCCPPRYSHGRYLLLTLALYGAALATERLDHPLFALGQFVSGHTVKHLLAALAVHQVTRMLRARTSA